MPLERGFSGCELQPKIQSVLLCAVPPHHRRQKLTDVLGTKVMGYLVWVSHLHVVFQ